MFGNVTLHVKKASQSCFGESIKLRETYEQNVLNLAKVSKCYELGVKRWKEIWLACSDMKNLYLYPFVNIYYIIQYNCITFMKKLAGIGITIVLLCVNIIKYSTLQFLNNIPKKNTNLVF